MTKLIMFAATFLCWAGVAEISDSDEEVVFQVEPHRAHGGTLGAHVPSLWLAFDGTD